jgi:hypothetical protein
MADPHPRRRSAHLFVEHQRSLEERSALFRRTLLPLLRHCQLRRRPQA